MVKWNLWKDAKRAMVAGSSDADGIGSSDGDGIGSFGSWLERRRARREKVVGDCELGGRERE